ncbi:MAG: efflux RND transporter permease subunit [Treponema sp.]|jgi:HAE1 family hydrophobic/amphiphilic exporter-1|nr:efflux RND transporter permease subunit [Treponema sp.]
MKKRLPGFRLPRPAAPVFAFVMVSVLCVYILRQEELGEAGEGRYRVYSVRFEYFGMDETEIERLITIPLEEKISGLGDIYEIRSVSEYGKSVSSVYFDRKADGKRLYLALRDAVDALYSTLPGAVQKPRIFSAESGKRSFLSAAVFAPGDLNRARAYAEDRLKRELENLDGIAEVIVSGGTQREILIEFDPEKTAARGINPAVLGGVVQDANILSPGGTIYGKERNRTVGFRTRLGTPAAGTPQGGAASDPSGDTGDAFEDAFLGELEKLPVKAGETLNTLDYFARIGIQPRERREILRINGEECVGVDIVAASSADIIALSRKCGKILEGPVETGTGTGEGGTPAVSVTILRDTGRFFESAIRGVRKAILQSVLAVLLIIPLFFGRPRTLALILLFIGADILWSFAVLHIISVKPDENLLSGISISLGLIVDPCLVMASLAERENNPLRYRAAVPGLLWEIAASTLTTFLVILPLCFLDSIVPGIRKVALAIMAMLCNSLVLSVFFFAGFLFQEQGEPLLPPGFFRRTRRLYTRLSWGCCLFSLGRRRTMAGIYAGLAALSPVLFFVSGKNVGLDVQDQVLYGSVEYESEKSGESVDRDLEDLSDLIREKEGVRYVRLESRKGPGELEIGFDEKKSGRADLAAAVAALAPRVGNGFLYVPDAEGAKAGGGRYPGGPRVREIEVAAVGDDAGICREMAKKGARAMQTIPGYVQAVLNFKEAEGVVELVPHRDSLARSGLTVRDMARDLRWTVFGPVIDKRVQGGRETDIRLVGSGTRNGSLSRIANLPVSSPAGAVRLETLGSLRERPGTGKIYRRDGRRAAYFTVHLRAPSSSQAAGAVKRALAESAETGSGGTDGIEPARKGYGYLLSRDLELLEAQYGTLFFAFLGSGGGIFLVLLCLTEKWRSAVRIASIIPVSCAVPLLVRFLSGKPLEMGDMAALVVISGLSVNNAIYIEGARLRAVHFRVREKIQSILTTSLTGIAGAAPLALMGGEGFPAALSRGILWGTLGSLAAAILLFPALCGPDQKTVNPAGFGKASVYLLFPRACHSETEVSG